MLKEPYSSFVSKWKKGKNYLLDAIFFSSRSVEGFYFGTLNFLLQIYEWSDELSTKMEDSEDIRRAGFVDSLLNVDASQPMISMDSNIFSDGENIVEPQKLGACDDPSEKGKFMSSVYTGNYYWQSSHFLFMELVLEIKIKKLMVLVMECFMKCRVFGNWYFCRSLVPGVFGFFLIYLFFVFPHFFRTFLEPFFPFYVCYQTS